MNNHQQEFPVGNRCPFCEDCDSRSKPSEIAAALMESYAQTPDAGTIAGIPSTYLKRGWADLLMLVMLGGRR